MRTAGIFLVLVIVSCAKTEDKCISHDSCDGCIRELGCSWSVRISVEQDSSGCFFNNNTGVYQENVYNPGSSLTVVENTPVGQETRVSPQKVQAHLRLHTPVFFKVSLLSNQDSLVTPHHQNLIVQLLRTKPDFVTVKVEALSCPKDQKDFRQTIRLGSTQSKQSVTLDVYINCECPL